MERKDKSPEKTKGELNNTEKAEIIQSFLQQISDILKDKKNAKNKNQGDEIIDEFAMDLASIKKSPERLSKNIQSFWEHVKALQTTPLYKKHKALIDNIINLFPELSEIDTSEPDNSESEKETNYYDLLDKLQNAINKNDSEVVENILQSIQTMQIRIGYKKPFLLFDKLLDEIGHLQNNINNNQYTSEYLKIISNLIKQDVEECRDVAHEQKDKHRKYKFSATMRFIGFLVITIISWIGVLHLRERLENTQEELKQKEEQLNKENSELEEKKREIEQLTYKLRVRESLNTPQPEGNQ